MVQCCAGNKSRKNNSENSKTIIENVAFKHFNSAHGRQLSIIFAFTCKKKLSSLFFDLDIEKIHLAVVPSLNFDSPCNCRGTKAVVRGAVPCASQVLDRGTEVVARGAASPAPCAQRQGYTRGDVPSTRWSR
jgi:hypothetical protein